MQYREEYHRIYNALRDAKHGTAEFDALMAVVSGEENARDTACGEENETFWRVAYDSISYTDAFASREVQAVLENLGYSW